MSLQNHIEPSSATDACTPEINSLCNTDNIPKIPSDFWTPGRTELLIARWQAGCSGLEIAIEVGSTRSAVIGKAHRMKLKREIDNTFWTEEQTTILQRLWLRGDSAEDIAVAIHRRGHAGPHITRSSVISKAYKIGLKARRRTRARPEARSRFTGVDPTLNEGPAPEGFLAVTFENLADDQCHYPRGGGEKPIVFCGKKKMEASPYCIDCHPRCYSAL